MDILTVSGSLRKNSYNSALLRSAVALAPATVNFSTFNSLAAIPCFNPDVHESATHQSIVDFQQAISTADAIIISTPEYAHGIPGALKNALDCLVSSSEIILKPIAVMSVSTSGLGGFYAHRALVEVLQTMNTNVIIEASLNIPFAKSKFTQQGELIDPITRQALSNSLCQILQVAKQYRKETLA